MSLDNRCIFPCVVLALHLCASADHFAVSTLNPIEKVAMRFELHHLTRNRSLLSFACGVSRIQLYLCSIIISEKRSGNPPLDLFVDEVQHLIHTLALTLNFIDKVVNLRASVLQFFE